LPSLTLTTIPVETGTSRFELEVHAVEQPDGLSLTWVYNDALFEEATVARMAANFAMLLEGILAAPAQPIQRLPLLTETERRTVVETWNATAAPFPAEACVHQAFEAQVPMQRRHPR